jgi:hypothetical protein
MDQEQILRFFERSILSAAPLPLDAVFGLRVPSLQ